MRIVVDMDEVLFNFVDPVLDRWNLINGTTFTRGGFNMWDMSKTLGPGAYEIVESWISKPHFFRDLQPLHGAVDGFNYLIREYEVVVATSIGERIANAYDGKRECMKRHFPRFDLKNLIITSRKELIDGDVLIDDAVHNIKPWAATQRMAILHDRPWNKPEAFGSGHSEPAPYIIRCKTWDKIIHTIDNMNHQGEAI